MNEPAVQPKQQQKWGIDLLGRRMWYAPWPTDEAGAYRAPSETEIEEIYGISGEAVAETLAYFEERCTVEWPEGNPAWQGLLDTSHLPDTPADERTYSVTGTDVLLKLLNEHVIDPKFRLGRDTLLDPSRWYNNEYYFYFIMFTKKVMGRYDFHFGEGSEEQLSVNHRIYEQGFLHYPPWGKDAENIQIPIIFVRHYVKKGVRFDDYFTWANGLTSSFSKLIYEKDIATVQLKRTGTEFNTFLYEIIKVLTNKHSIASITYESFPEYEFYKFSNLPNSMISRIVKYMILKSTTIYDIKKIDIENKSVSVNINYSDSFHYWELGKYALSATSIFNQIVVGGLKHAFKYSGNSEITLEYTSPEKMPFLIKFYFEVRRRIPILKMFLVNVLLFGIGCFFINSLSSPAIIATLVVSLIINIIAVQNSS